MPFSDDDLARLKKTMETYTPEWNGFNLNTLLARLEAAEAYAKCVAKFQSPNMEAANLKEAWHRSKGLNDGRAGE